MKKINLDAVRVVRGGNWSSGESILRAAFRVNYSPSNQNFYVGVRLVRRKK